MGPDPSKLTDTAAHKLAFILMSLTLVVTILFMLAGVGRTMTTSAHSSSTRAKLVFHWFRLGDLRVHDSPALTHSSKIGDTVVPTFCFDSRIFGDEARTKFGSLKCGPRRAKFILESVADLRRQLQNIGSGLSIHCETTPDQAFDTVLQQLSAASDSTTGLGVCTIVCQKEVLKEEKAAVNAVRSVLKKHSQKGQVIEIWGSTMYELNELPFDVEDMPDGFTPFRNKVEKNCKIDPPLATPKKLSLPATNSAEHKIVAASLSFMPTLKDLGYTEEQIASAQKVDPRSVMEFRGGETAGLARVKDYIWTKDLLRVYFDTRNGMIGGDYSSKFSPWLAHGCISPRHVASECRRYEQQVVANKSTYWLVFEMLWRDFCKFFCLKHGDAVFKIGGTIGDDKKWSSFEKNLDAWKQGRTGYPLVDANMREMAATGFMSNRGRQNVCSFLAIDLNHDWRLGGDWFESQLLDYDVYSNWFNWCSGAGMTGGRLNRFNIAKQSKDYDQHGEYVKLWCPELKNLPKEFVHEPWKMNQFQQMEFKCKLGVDYPNPVVPPSQPKYGGGGNGGPKKGGKPKDSNRNRHQKQDMKSLKQGDFKMR